MKKYFYLFALLAFFACNEEDRFAPNSQGEDFQMSTKADFVRLQNSKTGLAGTLEILTKEPVVSLRWNVPEGCNVDTTTTSLPVTNGKVNLPIKWDKMSADSTYAPSDKIFEGGVLVTAKDYSKYIRLLWTENLDSAKVEKAPVFYGTARNVELPKAETLEIVPKIIRMSKNVNSYDFVVTASTMTLREARKDFEYDNEKEKLNLILSSSHGDNPVGMGTPNDYNVSWTEAGAPENPFVTHILFTVTTNLYGYVHFVYEPDNVEADSFDYLRCSPDTITKLPATGTDINVVVKTNQKWYINSDQSEEGEKIGEASYPNGERLLTIKISPNTTLAERPVVVTVETDEGVQKTLSFIQSAPSQSFEFVSADPNPDLNVPLNAGGETINIEVNNHNQPWWIEYNGNRINVLQQNSTSTYDIPRNPDAAIRDVVLNVGYTNSETNNDIVVKQLKYKQQTGNELAFVELIPLETTISANATIITAKFQGNYVGGIKLRAYWTGGGKEGEVVSNLNPQVEIPNNYGSLSDRQITFKYQLDGETEWKDIETAIITQSGATITASVKPDGNIPVEGGQYLCFLSGLYTGDVDIRCTMSEGKIDSPIVVVASETGKAGDVKTLEVPANTTGKLQNITFEYSAKGANVWYSMASRIQDTKSTIEHDGEIKVDGFEDQKENQTEVEVE